MRAIYKRELKSFFTSMTAYIFIAVYLILFGIYFRYYNLTIGVTSIGYPTLYGCYFCFFLFALITMKSLPEEKKDKIDQLLYTSPVPVYKIVMGKYFAMCTVFMVVVAIIATCPLVIKSLGYSMLLVDYTSLSAYFLLGCVYIAICMFISSLTENQIISAIISLVVIFFLEYCSAFSSAISDKNYVSLIFFVLISFIAGFVCRVLTKSNVFGVSIGIFFSLVTIVCYIVKPSAFTGLIQKVLKLIPPSNYLINFIYYYMFDLKAVVYFLSLICLFVFLTIQTIQKRRYS